jgi:hypothetical protein
MSINRQKRLFSVQDTIFMGTPLRNPGPIRRNMAEVATLISGRAKKNSITGGATGKSAIVFVDKIQA